MSGQFSKNGVFTMWEDTLKKSMSEKAKKLAEEVLDSEPRSLNEILDLMWEEVERKRKSRSASGDELIPTRGELRSYLSKHYNSVLFDKHSNRQMKSKTRNSERRYWK